MMTTRSKEVIEPSSIKNCSCGGVGVDAVYQTSTNNNDVNYPYYYRGGCCAPPPPYPYPYPYPVPVNPAPTATYEMKIAKLSKKAAIIRSMIDLFQNKNKPIIFRIEGLQYNFGTYTTEDDIALPASVYPESKDPKTTSVSTKDGYGQEILEILETELDMIKTLIKTYSDKIAVDDESSVALKAGLETTVVEDPIMKEN